MMRLQQKVGVGALRSGKVDFAKGNKLGILPCRKIPNFVWGRGHIGIGKEF